MLSWIWGGNREDVVLGLERGFVFMAVQVAKNGKRREENKPLLI